jgi:hypothetical protein
MRGDVAAMDLDKELYRAQLAANYAKPEHQAAHVKRHVANQKAQATLRHEISVWAGYWHERGLEDYQIQRRFYFKFGIDILSAQALKIADAIALSGRVKQHKEELVENGTQ